MDGQANLRGTGVDLHLGPLTGTRVRAGLENALRDAVRDGRLAAGTRLPSSRTLAADLGIARNTVADAYGQLIAEGWLTARQGSGTRVAPGRPGPPDGPRTRRSERPATVRPATQANVTTPSEQTLTRAGLMSFPQETRLPYDLRPGSPDLSSFPRSAWLAATRQALRRAPNDVFGYGDPRGRPELREEIATYLARARGVRADPELVLICSGFLQAVGLLGRALRSGGARRMAVEALGFPDTPAILRQAGLTTVEIPVDADGARIDALGTADAVLLTPSHQYPTGVSLSPERRTAVVTWARRTGGTVIEDDYDGEFRYDRQAVGALQGLDPSAVVYAGTASKSLAPGLRLGWLVLPERLLEPVTLQKRMADHLSPVIEQLALAELIASGGYDRHVRRMRQHYRRRRDRLVAALAEHAPAVRVHGIAAGLHAVIELPPGSPSVPALTARAATLGLALAGPTFYGDLPEPEADPASSGWGTRDEGAGGAGVGGGGGTAAGAGGTEEGSAGAGSAGAVVPGVGDAGVGDAGAMEAGRVLTSGAVADRRRVAGPTLVIGFGGPPEHAFSGALERLCSVLAEATAGRA
ncbi:PLP-dependent aminotransferase family protein [Streptomyces sp. SL13]|uniref:PLP-dependent aminotransferase family protein n=1 Tax=Streptantibioticus silvisoli TaxID=2705255 RepID=A0AA90K9W5_9ACTN|nr:PLP-dependent aminotransferase family protein [Streptantibioticus silvisoli]